MPQPPGLFPGDLLAAPTPTLINLTSGTNLRHTVRLSQMPLLSSCQQRDYSVKGARSTSHSLHGGGLGGMLKRKLNNPGVWATQKFPSVIHQLKPTPGRHFACSSKMTVVGLTWRVCALHVLRCIFCPFLQIPMLLELAQ